MGAYAPESAEPSAVPNQNRGHNQWFWVHICRNVRNKPLILSWSIYSVFGCICSGLCSQFGQVVQALTEPLNFGNYICYKCSHKITTNVLFLKFSACSNAHSCTRQPV